jgi:ribonuclease P protein component
LDNRFPKSARILRTKDYQRVYEVGRRRAGQVLQLFYCANQLDHCRFGVSVGKRSGKAVRRNLLKRHIREGLRNSKAFWLPGWDVVVHAKSTLKLDNAGQIASELGELLKSLRSRK